VEPPEAKASPSQKPARSRWSWRCRRTWRSLVGGDDEVGIVAVEADHPVGADGLAVDEVVGDVEQAPMKMR
jgi:hypothetical protein